MSRLIITSQRKLIGLFAGLFLILSGSAFADGLETLGPPSIPIASGTGIVAAGTGTLVLPGVIDFTIPAGATVKQVLLYWEGFGNITQSDNQVSVNGISVVGQLAGGPSFFDFNDRYSYTYRADITNLNLVSPGANSLTITEMFFVGVNNGAGVMVIIDDGSGEAVLELRDGDDIAFRDFAPPADTTVPQTFTFPAASFDRTATISNFFGSVTGPASRFGPIRPNTIRVETGGIVTEFFDLLMSSDGDEWDTAIIEVTVPAGATSLTIQAISETRLDVDQGLLPASMVWIASGLQIPGPGQPDPASLGDRVWEDLDGDGVQDCTDTNNDGIVGNAGDAGAECGTGVPNVSVQLLSPVNNSCVGASSVIMTDVTDADGFYGFTNLTPGDYCVSFTKPVGYECTLANVNDGTPAGAALDSDGEDNGMGSCPVADLITLDPGENDPTWDLGLVQPRLGDRVWEDLDGDGTQDCSDDNMNGIIGDAGDSGPECGTGVDGVTVNLFTSVDNVCGNADDAMIGTAMTANGGFYGFSGIDGVTSGTYCVGFDPSTVPATFCDTTVDGVTYSLGAPVFTQRNQGADDSDSDADPNTGLSEATTISAPGNVVDLKLDAGIYCPAKIGDYVFEDENGDGIQDPGEDPVPGVKATLYECGPDMIAGTPDDVMTGEMRTTGTDGMYMFGAEPNFSLPPGKYFVEFDKSTLPPGYDFTTPGAGNDPALDSDCLPPGGGTSCVDLTTSRAIDLTRDCGIVPPPPPTCGLTLDKSCRVEPLPAPPAQGQCKGKLQQFTVKWNGSETITVSGLPNDATGPISQGDEVTFFGPFGQNDVFVDIAGSSAGTQSVFHMSCSDSEFNDPSDCGKAAGDGKGNDSSKVNLWLLEGFIDAEGTELDCTTDTSAGAFSDSCSFIAQPLPSCDNGPKPDFLTWRYDGGTGGDGDCADSTFATIVNADGKAHEDFVCAGQVDPTLPATIVDDNGNVYSVNPGGSFTVERDWAKSISITDSNGATQSLVFHTSCSQPLEAQATGGALTLAGLDNRTGGRDVTYRYEVMNQGDPLTNVGIEDDVLGTIASGLSLGTGGSATFDVTQLLLGTTTNTATATGTLPDGSACAPASAVDTVTVEAVIPPCSVSFVLDGVSDDALKIKITNTDVQDRIITLDSLSVSFPQARENLREVKLDGAIYKKDDSSNPILGTPASIGPNDWTQSDVSKRQLDAGEERTLEIKTTKKSDKNGRFEVTVTFAEGCSITIVVENQQVQ